LEKEGNRAGGEPRWVEAEVRLEVIAESPFLWMKNVFGKYIIAKKLENMAREITTKVFQYNPLI